MNLLVVNGGSFVRVLMVSFTLIRKVGCRGYIHVLLYSIKRKFFLNNDHGPFSHENMLLFIVCNLMLYYIRFS